MDELSIFDHLILAGGPPRSGTTLLAQLLSVHPQLALAGDNRAYESWGLFRYANYSGLVEELRSGRLRDEEARRYLYRHISREGWVNRVVPSPFLADNQRAVPDPPVNGVARFKLPVEDFGPNLKLCLKSPEISFVLPQLATLFPSARFVLVYRPVIEIAESMYRKGIEWPNAYHRRWNSERDASGNLIVPVNTPADLAPLWDQVTNFQRCVIRATAFLRAMLEGAEALSADRVYIYYHPRLRERPSQVLSDLAAFLGISPDGFGFSERLIRADRPNLPAEQIREFEEVSTLLGLDRCMALAEALGNCRRT
jgi:hypothetical protein